MRAASSSSTGSNRNSKLTRTPLPAPLSALLVLGALAFLATRPAPEMALLNERAEHVHDRPRSELRRHVGDVVGRRDLDHLHAADALAGDHAEGLQRLPRKQ